MKDGLEVGMSRTRRIDIDKGRTIGFMGEDLRVYATPEMVRDMEQTCLQFVKEFLDDNENSVGIRVEIDHMGPTLIGMWADITATVIEVKGSKISFDFEVHDQIDQVGRGKHVRFVVELDQQKSRLEAKRAKMSEAKAV